MKFLRPDKYIEGGLITERFHQTAPLVIYNYTPKCQFDKAWDDVTMMCRGLIVSTITDEVVARPFKKFFNYDELVDAGKPLPEGTPTVHEKRDGSLGILYWTLEGGELEPNIATRGSFDSDQARWATSWIRKHGSLARFDKFKTYLFEIIYPENRIVVDYGDYCGLDLIAILDTETGEDEPYVCIKTPLGSPVRAEEFVSVEQLKGSESKNREGFVLLYPDGTRVKIKFDEYVKLHKIITGLSERGIWEMVMDQKTLYEILEGIPDEMHGWVRSVHDAMFEKAKQIMDDVDAVYTEVMNMDRKSAALIITKTNYPAVVFTLLDKDMDKATMQILKLLKPKGQRTFRKDVDA